MHFFVPRSAFFFFNVDNLKFYSKNRRETEHHMCDTKRKYRTDTHHHQHNRHSTTNIKGTKKKKEKKKKHDKLHVRNNKRHHKSSLPLPTYPPYHLLNKPHAKIPHLHPILTL